MAPEVMCRQNHSVAVDYFALGVLAYEFMLGKRPYTGKTRKDIRDAILAKQVQIRRSELPPGWSAEAADFINKCLQRKPLTRLGAQGPNEVKHHIWLKDFSWALLKTHSIKSPLDISFLEENFDARMTVELDYVNTEERAKNEELLRNESLQKEFIGYYFDKDEEEFSTARSMISKLA